ncbi:hypothetical protein FRC18_010108 [Serendipita sp. 400]|nr:hypothetical protein FRC18_010108 [Serendipita sp. 400]
MFKVPTGYESIFMRQLRKKTSGQSARVTSIASPYTFSTSSNRSFVLVFTTLGNLQTPEQVTGEKNYL